MQYKLCIREQEVITALNLAKLSTFIIGINFLLSSFYNIIYFFILKVRIDNVGLTFFDFINTGLMQLHVVIVVLVFSFFSLKREKKVKKAIKIKKSIKKIIDKINEFWIPEILICLFFVLLRLRVIKSDLAAIIYLISPFFVYLFYFEKFEEKIKIKIPLMHKLALELTFVILILFTLLGTIDGIIDRNNINLHLYSVTLRYCIDEGSDKKKLEGYLIRRLNRNTLMRIDGKITNINNDNILSLTKLK